MADKSNWYDFLIPEPETKEAIQKGIDEALKTVRILKSEGPQALERRRQEERFLDQGFSDEESKSLAADAIANDKRFRIIPKDISLISKAQAIEPPDDFDVSSDLDKVKPPKVEEVKKIGMGSKDDYEVGLSESITGALASTLIKIPKGVINFGTLVTDALTQDGVPVDKSLTERFNTEFEKTILGQIEAQAEESARATAIGHLTEAFGQLYGGYKIAGKTAIPVVEYASRKARQLGPILVNAIKTARYGKTVNNKNLSKAFDKAKNLNKASKFDKFAAVTVGGGFGTAAVVMKQEDIGTLGDIDALDFLGTGQDREKKETANDDAFRQLNNKFKFGAELAFPVIPFVYGTGKVAKMLATKGKDLAFSDSSIERWVDKFVGKPFRSRSNKPQQIFDGIQRLEGKKSSVKILADDAARSFDDVLKKISRNSTKASEAIQDPNQLSEMFSKFLLSTDDVVKKNNIVFKGFSKRTLNSFRKAMDDLGVNKNQTDELINNGIDFRIATATLKNTIAKNKNTNVATKELNQILNDRVRYNLGADYKIFDMNMGLFDGFKPTLAAKEEVARIIQKYHRRNGERKFSIDDAMIVVNNILKNRTLNPVTRTPEFPIGTVNILDDQAVQMKNIGNNITAGGKFKADKTGGLIQKKSDLEAFNTLFGKYTNAKNVIYNVMTDLAEIVARDEFYTKLLKDNDALLAKGERGLFYPNYNKALINLGKGGEISKRTKFETRLSDEVYSSPLDNKFTLKIFEDAIKAGDKVVASALTRSLPYRAMMLIPKGISQAGKTILGPFTHIRNFFSAVFTTVHSGNILIPPAKLAEFANQARKSVQPQLLYRMTGNPRFRNQPEDQALYRFLLEEGVTNQNVVARDIEGLFGDITLAGQRDETAEVFFNKLVDTTTKKFKKLYGVAQDLYTAEDDVFRIVNFLAEGYKLKEAYRTAIKNGIKNADGSVVKMPGDLEIMKESAKIIRETVPNYAYVSDFVKGIRRSPLGSFASFPAEIFRTGGNTTMLALKELKDPIRETIGMKRLTGQAITYTFFPIAAMKAGSALYGVTREKLTAMREILPVWSEDNTIIGVYEDGQYKYIDFSHGFFYDTLVSPVSTVLSNVQKAKTANEDDPLVVGFVNGLTKAMGKVLEPFFSESIWFGAVADIMIRNGVKDNGSPVWNPDDSIMTKWTKSTQHVAYTLSPGSLPQVRRLINAIEKKSQKGVNYEVPDELLGFLGFRKVPLDIESNLNFKITDFQESQRNESKKIFEGLRTGDPVEDPNAVIRQYFNANKSYYEDMSKLRRVYDAVKTLGMRDEKIEELFGKRNEGPLYGDIENNSFFPLLITKGQIIGIEEQAEDKKIPNILNRNVLRIIERMERDMQRLRLNKDFDLDINNYLIKTQEQVSELQTPPLPKTVLDANPNPQVIQTSQVNQINQGLTMTENALLSDDEKMIRLRQRNMIT
tara:strand:+ start:368 stop:4702 length:4335 start_codon:yes stop_codon:yes gene_type:complete